MKRLAILLTLVPSLAWAQGGPLQQGGAVTPGHVPVFVTNGVVGDGGSAQNGSVKEIGITGQGTPFCLNDAATTGPYHQLCFGANSLGGGLVSFQAYNGAPVIPLNCNINGVQTACELSGSNVSNIPGPLYVAGPITAPGGIGTLGLTAGTDGLTSNGPLNVVGEAQFNSGDVTIAGGNITAPIGNISALGFTAGTDGVVSNGPLNVVGEAQFNSGDVTIAGGNITTPAGVYALGFTAGSDGIVSAGPVAVSNDVFANSFQLNSDTKLKTDVQDFRIDATAALKKLRPVSYRFGGKAGRHVGMIADEVEKVVPAAVGEHNGIKTLDPMALIDVLITANHELAERVEALEKRLPAAH